MRARVRRPGRAAAAAPPVLVLQLDVPLTASVTSAVAAMLEQSGTVRVVLVPSARSRDVAEARSRRDRELRLGLAPSGARVDGLVVEVARPGRWTWRPVGSS